LAVLAAIRCAWSLVQPGMICLSDIVCQIKGKLAISDSDMDVQVGSSIAITLGFLVQSMAVVSWFFKTGYRLKN
jgi:hypothetical protein